MKTILIVDDEVNIRAILSLALSDNYKVLEAGNGIEGLEMFEKYNPDLIITDCRMPIMTGFELVSKIRTKNNTVKIDILQERDSTVYQIEVDANKPFFWNPANTFRNGMLRIVGKASSSKSAFLHSKKAINTILNK